MEEEDVAAAVDGGVPANRRKSLASQMEEMASDGAFLRAIEHKSPQMNVCRGILRKPTGKRTLEDIHVLKSLFASSKLLDFFSNLDAFKLDRLYQSLEIVVYADKGVYVFHEGDDGDSFYLVYSGRVEVVKKEVNNPARPNGTVHLTFLHPGDTFGERALLSSTDVRAASVIVVSAPTELVFINRVVFSELLKESHDSSTHTLEITKRFRSNKDIVRNIFMRSSSQRSEKDLKFAVEYLKSVKFFSRFSFEVRKQLCKVMRLVSAVTNTVLFAEGQVGRHFYIIFTGCVDVSVRAKNRFEETKESVVSRLGEGEYFGRDEYEPLIQKYQNEYHAQYAQMLRKNAYFIGPEWDDNTIEGMCSVMTEKYIPYKGEICKQGSRASELFIVTRGECRIIHEGKHPITNARQIYELGRYGPNSVLGCAEASAGRFNDIFIREYSILAESPMKILVLSRFDIFHLMSAEARASLQRSSNGYIRESIQSRALKSVAWEKYKKTFISGVMAENFRQPFGGRSDISAINQADMLGKSQSAPLLPLNDVRTLVDPGTLMLERRRGVTKLNTSVPMRPGNGSPKESKQNNYDKVNATAKPEEAQGDEHPAPLSESSSEIHRSSSLTEVNQDTPNAHAKVSRSASGPLVLRRRSSTTTVIALKLRQKSSRLKLPPVALDDSTSDAASLSLAASGSGSTKSLHRRPKNLSGVGNISPIDKSARVLHSTAASIKEDESSSNAKEFRSDLRRCGRIRTEKAENIMNASKNGPAGAPNGPIANAATIWDPVHGVCQPFAVLGFMKEQTARPASRGLSLSLSSAKAGRSAKSAADQLRKAAVAAVIASGHAEFTRFRVFGKFRDVDEALNLFRRICAVEKTPKLPEGPDCSRFAIYKEDEMTMALENFSSADGNDARPSSAQFSAADLPQSTGQRFACVSVSLQSSGATCIEAIVVHVYQCFPTPQSAVRFARQVAATLLAPSALSIVPLFEWISLAELERFDARSNDLEQELELAMRRGGQESTWKARKEAVKKGVRHSKLKLPST